MGLWDFMKKKKGERTQIENSWDPPKKVQAMKLDNKEKDYTLTLLYEFLDGNYEERGYLDSLLYPETWYMEQNLESLKNEFLRMIHRVKFRYEDYISEADFLLESRIKPQKIESLEEVILKKKKAQDQLARVLEIEKGVEGNKVESQGYVFSYIRGFQKGLAVEKYYRQLEL